MKNNLCEIVCIIDRSGSMQKLKNDAIGGFNNFLKEQQEESGEAIMTLVQFDHIYELLFTAKPIHEVMPFDDKTYKPRGYTALLDAIGLTINNVGQRLSETAENERPGKIIFNIITDGLENASVKFNKSQIKEMIQHQRNKYNWEFIFSGANMDAFKEAFAMGIDSNRTQNYNPTSEGIKTAYSWSSKLIRVLRK